MKILNHPSIVEASPIKVMEGHKPFRYVLRYVGESCEPWVTHCENLVIDGETARHESFYWGHYFETKEQALTDWEARCRRGA